MNDVFKDLSFMVAGNMPEALKSTLIAKLEMIYPNALENVDTALEGHQNSFPSVHFSFWFKYGRRVGFFCGFFVLLKIFQGDGTPSDADPSTLRKNGKHHVNTSQNVPRASLELKENSREHHMIIEAFGPVFEWINQLVCYVFLFTFLALTYFQLKQLLPDSYETLSYLVEALPNCDISPVYPFSGFVLNVNVSTRIHRDWGDEDICLILVLADCFGGELCLLELGIVLKLSTGDIVVFKSAAISHFNLHYTGKRASMVFHTDKSARSWAKDRNGWDHNIYMLSTRSSSVFQNIFYLPPITLF
jgi:hypothetical protein